MKKFTARANASGTFFAVEWDEAGVQQDGWFLELAEAEALHAILGQVLQDADTAKKSMHAHNQFEGQA